MARGIVYPDLYTKTVPEYTNDRLKPTSVFLGTPRESFCRTDEPD